MKNRVRILLCLVAVLALALCVFTACNVTTIQKVQFKVAFEVDGLSYYEISTQGTEVLQMPANPTKGGYIFDGWYWDKDTWKRPFTANSLLNEALSADMRVYAKWKRDCAHTNVVDDIGYDATCTENGLTNGSHCENCGEVMVTQEIILALKHDIKQVSAKEPTCTDIGWNAYEYCTRCEYTTKAEIEANGHTEGNWITDIEPTCLTKGHKYQECSICHMHLKEEDIDALNHDIKQVSAKAPTCTDVGWGAYEYCSRCDYTTKVEIPATGHHYSDKWENDETYHWHDADCGHSLTTEKIKHSFDEHWKCTVCDYQDITLHGTELKSRTLQIDGTNLYAKVSNATETFSFINDISVADGAIYTVHTDISCSSASELRAKTTPLQIGDNTLYILVSNGNDIELYTVEIRRRPMYTVSFNTNGGNEIECRQVEEDCLTDAPSTIRNGYIFDGWDYDFDNAITEDTVISANWITIVRNIQYALDLDIEHTNPLTYIYDDDTIQLSETSKDGAYFVSWYLNGEYVLTLDAHQLVDYNLVGYVGTVGLGITDSSVMSYSGATNSVIIPSKYKGVEINSIGENAFKNCNKMTEITIPEGVTSIGSYAFYGCSGLMSVTIGNSVTSIGNSAFSGCSGLMSVTIGNSVTSIGSDAFYGCSGLTSVVIPDSVTSIGGHAFCDCSKLTSVTIPNSVTSIDSYAFYRCSGLTSVIIPESITSIGYAVFSSCLKLTTVNWNARNAKTNNYAEYSMFPIFSDCTCLKTVNIGENVAEIPESAFRNCSELEIVNWNAIACTVAGSSRYPIFMNCANLTTVNICDNVTTIPSCVFYGCSGLTSVVIPDSVTSIGTSAFSECSGLTSVVIPDSLISISSNAFSGCSALQAISIHDIAKWCEISFGGSYANPLYYAHNLYLTGELITDLVIPDSVKNIGDYAFLGYTILSSVTIGNSVTSIGDQAFSGCSGLTSVTIGNVVTSIGDYAFDVCSGLTSVTIGNSVTSIGVGAFRGCSRLTSITIPFVGATKDGTSNTHLGYIFGASSFSDNSSYVPSSLKEVIITDGTRIDDWAFSGCNGLTSITFPDSLTSIGSDVFYNFTGLTSITIPDSVTSIGDRAFYNCSGLKAVYITDLAKWCEISFGNNNANPLYYAHNLYLNGELVTDLIIPDSVTHIGSYAFYGCSSLTNVTIPNSVTSIGNRAFYNCSELTAVYITDLAKWCEISFGNNNANPLYYVHNLYLNGELVTDLIIPDSVTHIGSYAFYGCSSLTNVIIPNSVTSIGEYAFDGCDGLEAVYITDLVKWCGIVFSNYDANPLCDAHNLYLNGELVTDLVIPNSVTSIGNAAFVGCRGLTSITIPNSVTSIGEYAFDGCRSLTSVTIGNSVTRIGSYAFRGCSGLTSVTIGNSVTSIGEYAFSGCTGLTSIEIPDSVTSIGGGAFHSCSSITSITIPDSVTSIGNGAFMYCRGLTSITIPDGVTIIGKNVFYSSVLQEVYYKGTTADWAKIDIDSDNTKLLDTTVYYYSEQEPSLNEDGTAYDGNYWYYDTDGNIVVWKKESI